MISSLQIKNFRNLACVDFTPCPEVNLIVGANGSGKTSILEAIYFLGRGKSFRTSSLAHLIRHEQLSFSLFSQILKNDRWLMLGMERLNDGNSRYRLDETDIPNIVELAQALPLSIINSNSHQLLEGGPLNRRKFIDWGLFYHHSHFMLHWKQFELALKQRNAALRARRPRSEIEGWTQELIKHGTILSQLRSAYIQKLTPYILAQVNQLLPLPFLSIHYHPGWDASVEFGHALERNWHNDVRQGFTQLGPHRADLGIGYSQGPIKQNLSRGQQKLLIYGMMLAQGFLLLQEFNRNTLYLMDDLTSELDNDNRMLLFSHLGAQKTQFFVTAIEGELVLPAEKNNRFKLFHVKHGRVSAAGN